MPMLHVGYNPSSDCRNMSILSILMEACEKELTQLGMSLNDPLKIKR